MDERSRTYIAANSPVEANTSTKLYKNSRQFVSETNKKVKHLLEKMTKVHYKFDFNKLCNIQDVRGI